MAGVGLQSTLSPVNLHSEIKEESCHHSRQALTAIECILYRMEMLYMCHLKLFSLPYSSVELGVGCSIVTHHVTPEPVTEVAVTPSPPPFGLLH